MLAMVPHGDKGTKADHRPACAHMKILAMPVQKMVSKKMKDRKGTLAFFFFFFPK